MKTNSFTLDIFATDVARLDGLCHVWCGRLLVWSTVRRGRVNTTCHLAPGARNYDPVDLSTTVPSGLGVPVTPI